MTYSSIKGLFVLAGKCLTWVFVYSSMGCDHEQSQPNESPDTGPAPQQVYTTDSQVANAYRDFDAPCAINQAAAMENEYFHHFQTDQSRYYGTMWALDAMRIYAPGDSCSTYERYLQRCEEAGIIPDSLHCTHYAIAVLKAGMGEKFETLVRSHRRIWGDREYAGWSVGYLLVKEFAWEAWLIIEPHAEEYTHCLRSWRRNQSYPVWKQPDIPLQGILIRGEQDSLVLDLLRQNQFAWGFSYQGIHTWFTRFTRLKECNWSGAPASRYATDEKRLFITTEFMSYHDYASHVVIFPPKKQSLRP